MEQPLSDALAESARTAVRADELERDRIAWNLPRSAPDETSDARDSDELEQPKLPVNGEPGR